MAHAIALKLDQLIWTGPIKPLNFILQSSMIKLKDQVKKKKKHKDDPFISARIGNDLKPGIKKKCMI